MTRYTTKRICGIFPAGGIMMQTKKSRPVLAHHGGKGKTFTIILPLLRWAVKLAATAVGVYMAAAIAALNIPAFLVGMLLLNALLGIYFKIVGIEHEKV